MIAIESLSVDFGGLKALDTLTLAVRAGEIVGVVGPDGSGKTTLLDAIQGAVLHASGTMTFEGTSLDRMPMHKRALRGIARTYQTPRLFLRMSAFENVATGAYARTDPKGIDGAAIRDALTAAGYTGAPGAFARDVSENDRRKIELARALTWSPRLLLLDEPFAPFDGAQRDALRARLVALARDRKAAVLIAERDLVLCAPTCDRVLVLHAGKKVAEGKPDDLGSDPDVRDAYFGVEWGH